ncbi:MAG TPA: CAP domain-containing protein [Bryobacteraceae bacterium]|jgi:pathogenesis-related protein 1|nr:CAP domain-containing protein [Bryobacteraceae bacterium]
MRLCSAVFLALAVPCIAQSSGMLAAHNAVRARAKVPPLMWSDKLAAEAQRWASRLLAGNKFDHNPDSHYGENLFDIRGDSVSPAFVVSAWGSEVKDYDYASNTCRRVCGHYTQIVWASTKQVGCGVARDSRREVWVCNYDPPGNWIGKRPY